MRKDVMKIGAAVLAACMLAGCGGQNTGTNMYPFCTPSMNPG